MEERKAKQVLSDLYGLLIEINFQRDETEILAELAVNPDPQISKHLFNIRRLTAKANAQAQKLAFHQGMAKLKELKARGIDELKNIFNPQEQAQLVRLFRKFDNTTEDEADLLEDEEFLSFMQLLKKEIDDDQPPPDH